MRSLLFWAYGMSAGLSPKLPQYGKITSRTFGQKQKRVWRQLVDCVAERSENKARGEYTVERQAEQTSPRGGRKWGHRGREGMQGRLVLRYRGELPRKRRAGVVLQGWGTGQSGSDQRTKPLDISQLYVQWCARVSLKPATMGGGSMSGSPYALGPPPLCSR